MFRAVIVTITCLAVFAPAPDADATWNPDTSMLQPDTVDLLHYVNENYPEVPRIGGYRPDRIPDHPTGRALDIMTGGDMGLGDRIAADLREHQGELHIRYILWRVANHYDHVHACVD
jgi:peptidoglycan DL-endopeptidase CwlO